MSSIRIHNVHKSYDGAPVLREVFFRLSEGERVGLIGKNGAGKTTLLKLILGLEEPDDGTVEIDDGVRIGYFSQFSQLDGEQSVSRGPRRAVRAHPRAGGGAAGDRDRLRGGSARRGDGRADRAPGSAP